MRTRDIGDVTVIDATPRITLRGGEAAKLRDLLNELARNGRKKVVINLAETTYIDSSGVGEMVSGFTTIANAGGRLKLLKCSGRPKDLLQVTKLYTVFDVHEDEAKVVRSFG